MKAQMHRELESHHIIYLLVQRVRVGHSLNWVACEQSESIKINAALLVNFFFLSIGFTITLILIKY